MPNYNYLAINAKGKQVKGMINANNNEDLEAKLKEIGLELVSAKKQGKNRSFLSFGCKITDRDLILMCTHFEQLDRAGVAITESIVDLRDSTKNPQFRDLMQDIYEAGKAGKLLSEAMASRSDIFDEIFIGLIAAGEKTGNLYRSFKYLSEH